MFRKFNPNYNQCYIYKLIINNDGYYIGATTQSLQSEKK